MWIHLICFGADDNDNRCSGEATTSRPKAWILTMKQLVCFSCNDTSRRDRDAQIWKPERASCCPRSRLFASPDTRLCSEAAGGRRVWLIKDTAAGLPALTSQLLGDADVVVELFKNEPRPLRCTQMWRQRIWKALCSNDAARSIKPPETDLFSERANIDWKAQNHLILISFKWDCDLYLRWGFSCRPSSELRNTVNVSFTILTLKLHLQRLLFCP